MPIWITLTESQIAQADKVGEARHKMRIATASVHKNNRHRNAAADLENDKSAARCELAAHLGLLTRAWNDLITSNMPLKKMADLDGFIDVKERRKSRHNLIVQFDDPVEFAYVSVCSEQHPDYSIDAWCWGREAKQDRFRGELVPGRPSYVIGMIAPIMRSPYELREIVKTQTELIEHTCEQCNGIPDGKEKLRSFANGRRAWLHDECVRFFSPK